MLNTTIANLPTISMKIVIVSDSFKGSLTSAEVAQTIAETIHKLHPAAETISLPVGDGGEGTADALIKSLHGEYTECIVADPIGRPILSHYGIADIAGIKTVLIDMASASGLILLSDNERNPMYTSTYGTGRMILDAYQKGGRDFIIGLGGSATCDAGIGMLSALGFKFFDKKNCILPPVGASLDKIFQIDSSSAYPLIQESRFTIISDVSNPLYGKEGAARVFAPQKGATSQDVLLLDEGLRNFAHVCAKFIGKDYSQNSGTGAAGGLGFAFNAFLNAEIKPGTDTVLDLIDFDRILDGADLVITGEGKIDAQTLYGKLPMGVYQRAKAQRIPVIVLAGRVEDEECLLAAGFSAIHAITPEDMPLSVAMRPDVGRRNIAAAIPQIFANFDKAHKSD